MSMVIIGLSVIMGNMIGVMEAFKTLEYPLGRNTTFDT
jgi:hypothetical protein